jgi:hypothetical protein
MARVRSPLLVVLVAAQPVLAQAQTPPPPPRGPGNQVFAYFAKADEKFANLWQGIVEDGQPIGATRIVARGDENTFTMLSGLRVSELSSGMHVVVTTRSGKPAGGTVSVFGSWPVRTVWSKTRP